MKNELKKYYVKIACIWLICVVLISLFYSVILKPVIREVNSSRKKLAEQSETLIQASELIGGNRLLSKKQYLSKCKEQFGQLVAHSSQIADMSLYLSRIAGDLNIKDFSTRGKGQGYLSEIPNCPLLLLTKIDIYFKCSYEQFIRLVQQLEKHKPVFLINKFTMKNTDKQHSLIGYNMSLEVVVQKPQSDEQG